MAVAHRATGTYVNGTAKLTPGIPAGAAAGDMMLCFYGTKPYNDAPTIDQGWTDLGSASDGTTAAGVDVGSMQMRVFYKQHTGSESNPTVTNSTNNVSGAVIIVFQKDSGYSWLTPAGAGGGDATAGTGFSVTAASNPGINVGDMLAGYAAIRSDAGTQSSITITATSATVGSFTESPATDLATTSGGDMAMSGGYVSVTAGAASAAPVYASTLAASHTGAAYIVRLRQELVIAGTVGTSTAAGAAATVSQNEVVGASIGTASGSGAAASVSQPVTVDALAGAATASGLAATVTSTDAATGNLYWSAVYPSDTIAGTTGAATASGLQAATSGDTTISAALGSAAASGLQAAVTATDPATGNLYWAAVYESATVAGAVGGAVAAGAAASVSQNETIGAALGLAAASGAAATVSQNEVVDAATAAAFAAGLSAAVTQDDTVAATTGAALASGLAADVTAESGATLIDATIGLALAEGLPAAVTGIEPYIEISLPPGADDADDIDDEALMELAALLVTSGVLEGLHA